MKLHSLLLLGVFASAVAGCKSGDTATGSVAPKPATATTAENTITGTWEVVEAAKDGVNSVYEFKPDGKYVMSLSANSKGMQMSTNMTGTYKTDGKKIALKMDSLNNKSSDPATQKENDKANAASPHDLPGTLKWTDKDHVVLHMEAVRTFPAQDFTLKRKV